MSTGGGPSASNIVQESPTREDVLVNVETIKKNEKENKNVVEGDETTPFKSTTTTTTTTNATTTTENNSAFKTNTIHKMKTIMMKPTKDHTSIPKSGAHEMEQRMK